MKAAYFLGGLLAAWPLAGLACPSGHQPCGESCIPRAEKCPLDTELPAYQGWRARMLESQRTPLSGVEIPPSLPRVYVWRDPQTGSRHYSGQPPQWYGDPEQAEKNPRTQVYEGMYLVDDTRLSGLAAVETRQRNLAALRELEAARAALMAQAAQEQALIDSKTLMPGMAPQAVLKIWGPPLSSAADREGEEWIYGPERKVYFRNGVVERIEGGALSKLAGNGGGSAPPLTEAGSAAPSAPAAPENTPAPTDAAVAPVQR